MASTTTPQPGQVYRLADGHPALYVRMEQRPGSSEPEHLLVLARGRIVMETWHAALPEEYALVLDTGLQARVEAAKAAFLELRRERNALVATMKEAIRLAPEHASALKDKFRQERDPDACPECGESLRDSYGPDWCRTHMEGPDA